MMTLKSLGGNTTIIECAFSPREVLEAEASKQLVQHPTISIHFLGEDYAALLSEIENICKINAPKGFLIDKPSHFNINQRVILATINEVRKGIIKANIPISGKMQSRESKVLISIDISVNPGPSQNIAGGQFSMSDIKFELLLRN